MAVKLKSKDFADHEALTSWANGKVDPEDVISICVYQTTTGLSWVLFYQKEGDEE